MPAARVTFLAIFVLLFAAAWSNDPGLQAAPSVARISREAPITPPKELRPRMADGHWHSTQRSGQILPSIHPG